MANLLDLIDGLNNSEKKQRQRQLDYWRDREETQKQHNITDLNEYNRELDKIYSAMITDCQNQINDWYMRYATKEGISIADAKKRVSTADQKYYAERAKEYVANKDFSDKANREMRLYNLTMKVNRMELLKANLGMAMTGSYSDIEKLTGEFLDKKTLEELKRQAVILGKGVEDSEKRANDIVNASFKNATFSDRLWADMDSLRQSINVQVQRSLIRGLNPVEIARGFMPQLRDDARKARYATERLARTEMSRVLTDAQMDSFKANGYDEYMIICERTACALCRPFDGQHFPLDEMEVGYNASPFHPNCVLPDTTVFAPDAEKLIRSEYLGDIVEFVTSDGTRLGVTPNHIVLTSRGWVRAKNLVKGDKIVRYCGNVGNSAHAEPTNHNGSVSIENLFTAVTEASGGSSCTVPSSPIDLKGDVVANSKIDIVNIDSELRDKLDSPLRQLVSDCSFVWTSETLEGVLSRQGSVALLLMGIGLASDGIMSGLDVFSTLFGSESADSKLPCSRNVSEYNARILKTLSNDTSADIVGFGEFLDALTAVVAGNNLSDIKIDDSSVGDHNSVALESSADSGASDTEFGGNLTNGCSRIISVDDIVDINVRYFSGHVYDTSCISTVYIANSIISSNCLCSQAPYMDRDELEQMIREIEAERGETEEDRRQAVINRRKQEWKERQAMREAQARAQSNKQTPKTIKSNDTAEVSRLLTEALEETYTNHIKINSMKASTIEEMKEYNASPVKANFGKLNPESASAVADTVSKLMKQYDTPLQAVRIMTKEELLGSMNSFAYVYHDYTVDSATMLINQSKFRDFEKHTARIVELSEKGYCAKIKPELASQYVATHEFGHSLINMEQPLSKKTNWLNADYDKVKTARSEIKTIYKKYMDDVGTLDAKCKELDNKYFNDYLIEQKMTAEEAEKLRAEYIKTSDQLEKVKISDYSMSCVDEFVAESFANSKLGVNQNPYAEEVVSVLDKYFGRKS